MVAKSGQLSTHGLAGRGVSRLSRCSVHEEPATSEVATTSDGSNGSDPSSNGASSSSSSSTDTVSTSDTPTTLQFQPLSSSQQFWAQARMALASPRRRFKKGSYLTIRLEGSIAEKRQPRFSSATALPSLCASLKKAALDPRITGVLLNIDILSVGWATVQEVRAHIAHFRASGKATVAWMKRGGEKEYYLACACAEVYVPPTAQLALRGLSVEGQFLRGVLDKAGVEPQVQRIGKYKSAGDQLLRRDMSEAQREQLGALLEDIYDTFLTDVSQARGKSRDDVAAMLDAGHYDMQKLVDGGWLSGLKYGDELEEDLKTATGGKKDEFAQVPLQRYKWVQPGMFGIGGKRKVAVVREQGAITGATKAQGGQITVGPLVEQLKQLAKRKDIAGIVLHVNSPGGDALASDIMWREIKIAAGEKPLVATMGNVAASGGYYMAMAAPAIVAHPLTITGSIGVVTGKFNLEELFGRVGFSKEVLSRGTYAELLQDYRPFNEKEKEYFEGSAEFAYASFRDKAAESRGLEIETMQESAQGRVWSGHRAIGRKLIDHIGGIDTAIALVKQRADIPAAEQVTQLEVSLDQPSIQTLLSAGGLSRGQLLGTMVTDPLFLATTALFTIVPALLQYGFDGAVKVLLGGPVAADGAPQVVLDRVFTSIGDGSMADSLHSLQFPQLRAPSIDFKSSIEAGTDFKDLL